ncbi:MAG: hypothetical protein AAF696_34190 [Bacteroidota bacterium]
MKTNALLKIALIAAITAVAVVVSLKLMGFENPTPYGGGVAGGVVGGFIGAFNSKSRKEA